VASSFRWDTSNFNSVKHMEEKLQRALYGVCKYYDGPVERYMKHNAPWTDRTTNARNGLSATAQKSGRTILGSVFAIILSHAVTYGIYLEDTKYKSARPIILPTIKVYAPKVIGTLTKILDRLGR
jgi:hypothetical protein